MTLLAVRADRLFDGLTCTDHTLLLIEDGRVVRVGGPVPDGAELLDLPGATLLPGLVDTHVHLAFDASPDSVAALAARDPDAEQEAMAEAATAQLRAGVTTVRDLGDRDYSALRLRASARPLPTIVAAGPPITSLGGHCHYLGGETRSGDATVRAAVRERAERGCDVIKVMASGGGLTPGTDVLAPQFTAADLRAVVDEAHRHGLPVTAHAHALPAVRQALDAGVDGIEHLTCLTENGVEASDALIDELVRRRVAIGATVGLVPVPGMVPPPHLAKNLPAILDTLRRLIAAGAVVVAGTDAGIAPVKPHGVLPRGLADLVAHGMTPLAALRAGTATAAAVVGLGARKGRLAPGLDADVLAVAGDPTRDIAALLHPVAVLREGERVLEPLEPVR
ncbi:amidohydrolase family protein [Pseudonocardia oroxyli]|uniref:Imidazolonepropionase n=1 Tax=Pseudonocardia oroxyli TaxID=366584 RepID=A0A1G7N4N8_PSEOR|nr:amidohydrolase family protein [Pseudonocardia oroxyli]SDF69003.1 Imidazolonepropionase [Pseudonocardia oroxyli]